MSDFQVVDKNHHGFLKSIMEFSKYENQDPSSSLEFAYEELCETRSALLVFEGQEADHAEVLDGFGDTIFVCYSGMVKYLRGIGMRDENILHVIPLIITEICKANMTKIVKGMASKQGGKIQKPDDFVAPDSEISRIVLTNLQ